jgi:cytidylate kinase
MTGPADHPRPSADEPPLRVASRRVIITIDGPAGTGKSSVARVLARRLGLEFLDTGAMYRAAAALTLDHHLEHSDHAGILAAVARADIRFDWTTDPPALLCDGVSVMGRIRTPEVTAIVSPISAIPELRQLMVSLQRRIADQHPRLVTEGRDQGSVVFPHADVKFYLFASADVRAQRRAEQLRAQGIEADVHGLRDEIEARDRSDSTRRDGPLTCPPDAIRIDTSKLSFDEVVGVLRTHVEQVLDHRSKKNDRLTVAHSA